MADHIPDYAHKTIQDLCARISELEQETHQQKMAVNSICQAFQMPVEYPDLHVSQVGSPASVRQAPTTKPNGNGRPDRYFGKSLASVVRMILAARHDSNVGPATAEDIYFEMVSGGYNFEDKSEENSKRALQVSLSKNSTTFRRLPNDMWGLAEWYGPAKATRPKAVLVSTPSTASDVKSGEEFDFAKIEADATASVEQ